jgi:hypothetical protein
MSWWIPAQFLLSAVLAVWSAVLERRDYRAFFARIFLAIGFISLGQWSRSVGNAVPAPDPTWIAIGMVVDVARRYFRDRD